MRIVDTSAKTRKEAIQMALDQLGCDLDEVQIEILDEGSKGFLGLGQRDVHVRVKAAHLAGDGHIEEHADDNIGNKAGVETHLELSRQPARTQTRRRGPKRGPAPRATQPGVMQPRAQPHLVRPAGPISRQPRPASGGGGGAGAGSSEQRPREDRGRDPDRGRDTNRGDRPQQGGGDRGPRPEGGGRGDGGGRGENRGPRREGRDNRGPRNDSGPRPEGGDRGDRGPRREPRTPLAPSKPRPRRERATPVDREAADVLGKSAAALLAELLEKMGMPGEVGNVLNEDDNIVLEVKTEHGGMLIGRKGKNLEALQFLINRIFVSGDEKDTVDRILIDIEGYRKRRKEQLEDMARKMADRVKTSGRALRLKPLDPQERRIVHLALEQDPDVRTFSLGNSLHRRVVIAPADESGAKAAQTAEDAPDDAQPDTTPGFEPDEYDNDPDFKSYEDDEVEEKAPAPKADSASDNEDK